MMRKIFAITLSVLFIIGMLAFTASAEEVVANISDGTIDSEADLLLLMTDSTAWAGSYTLTKDLNMSNVSGQAPIGNNTNKFTGTFDGCGYTISGINISTSTDYTGLFGYMSGATVKNIVVDGEVTSTSNYIGGIVGYATASTIENCQNKATVSGVGYVGGVVGYCYNVTLLTNCYNSGEIIATASDVGGVVGLINGITEMSHCWSTGKITYNNKFIGGLIGRTAGTINVKNCYADSLLELASDSTYTPTTNAVRAFCGYPSAKNFSACYYGDAYTSGDACTGIVAYTDDIFATLDENSEKWVQGKNGPELATYHNTENCDNTRGYYVVLTGENEGYHAPVCQCQDEGSIDLDKKEAHVYDDNTGRCTVCGVTASDIEVFDGEIGTSEEIIRLMNDSTLWGGTYTLTNDINLGDYTGDLEQNPIGSVETPFTGTFDGNGKTISGINITGDSNVGLFGVVTGTSENNAVIKNLTVKGTVTATGSYAGGFVGLTNGNIEISNVTNECTVSAGTYEAGGIIGRVRITETSKTVSVTNAINLGAISSTSEICAGIAARVEVIAAGTGAKISISKCKNTANITASQNAAGIVGYLVTNPAETLIVSISECLNTGNITATTGKYAGGLVGGCTAVNGVDAISIVNCMNTGDIHAGAGIVGGLIAGPLKGNDYIVKNFYTKGAVTYGTTDPYYVGAALGIWRNVVSDGDVYYYNNNGNVYSQTTGAIEVTAETYLIANTFTGLLNDDTWLVVDGHEPELAVFHSCDNTLGYYVALDGENEGYHAPACHCEDVNSIDLAKKEAHLYDNNTGRCTVCGAIAPFTDDFDSEIGTAEEIIRLMNDSSLWGGTYTLTNDINLEDYTGDLEQNPIGSTETPFTGTFDGNGKTISGINITGETNVGLFGVANGTSENNAVIKNLTIKGTITATGSYAGGFVGSTNGNIEISNVTNECTVSAGSYEAGGIIGRIRITETSKTVSITNAINLGAISSTGEISAGIAARVEVIAAGTGAKISISKCKNAASVTASKNAAGMVGYLVTNPAETLIVSISECLNTGNITANTGTYAGGLVGGCTAVNGVDAISIVNCMNTGDIHAEGGVIGGLIAGPLKGNDYIVKNLYTKGAVTYNNLYYVGAALGIWRNVVSDGNVYYYNNKGNEYSDTTGAIRVTDETCLIAETFTGLLEDDAWLVVDRHDPELAVFHSCDNTLGYYITLDGDNEGYHAPACHCQDESTIDLTKKEMHVYDDNTGLCIACGVMAPYDCAVNGHDYIAKADGIWCTDCEQWFDAPVASTDVPLVLSLDTTTATAGGTVTLTLSANTAGDGFWGTRFTVTAPEGFTLTSVDDSFLADTGFFYTDGQYMILSKFGDAATDEMLSNGHLNGEVLKLTYSVSDTLAEGSYPFVLTLCETLDANENYLETAMVSAEVSINEVLKGDFNNDGTVSIADVMLLLRAVVNDQAISNGDLNGDGKVGLVDVIRVMKLILK